MMKAMQPVDMWSSSEFKDTSQCATLICEGVAVDTDRRFCIAHCIPDERARVFDEIRDGGPVDMFAGVTILAELWEELVAALPKVGFRKKIIRDADFRWARFTTRVSISGEAVFEGGARFGRAEFEGGWIESAKFLSYANFARASFRGSSWFVHSSFQGDEATFAGAIFEKDGDFREATFEGAAKFPTAKFRDGASFSGATFMDGGVPGFLRRGKFLPVFWFEAVSDSRLKTMYRSGRSTIP